MQVFFVKNVNFFRFKVAELQTFILGQINLQSFFLNLGFLLGAILKKAFHAFNKGQIHFQTFFFKTLGFLLGEILKKTFQTFNVGRLRVGRLLFCWGLNRLFWALNRYCVFVQAYYSQFFI